MKIKSLNFRKFIFGILFISLPLNSKTISVCKTCDHKSIASAISFADKNDRIEVQEGIYFESPIKITKSITIIGIGNPTLDGKNHEHVVDIMANDVRIEGFKILNSEISDIHEYAGIHAENVKGCFIKNNFLDNNAYGIYLAKVENCLLQNNISIGNALNEVSGGNGIHFWYCNNIEVIQNKTRKHRDGIYLEFSTNLLIEENYSSESIRYGLHFMFSSGNRFYRNHFEYNSTGVAIMFSKNIEVKGNYFEKSKDANSYGILLKDISDSQFENNVFRENTIGITADNASRNTFESNDFSQNGLAFNMLGNCENNIIKKNNFLKNVFDISTNSKDSLNAYENNYWDRYTGFDLNRDGVGDKPFQPVRLFSYWVNIYPFLMVLFQSPVIEFLEIAERAFPIMSPVDLKDKEPKMKKYSL